MSVHDANGNTYTRTTNARVATRDHTTIRQRAFADCAYDHASAHVHHKHIAADTQKKKARITAHTPTRNKTKQTGRDHPPTRNHTQHPTKTKPIHTHTHTHTHTSFAYTRTSMRSRTTMLYGHRMATETCFRLVIGGGIEAAITGAEMVIGWLRERTGEGGGGRSRGLPTTAAPSSAAAAGCSVNEPLARS
jgi:hypothetical protein